MNHPSIFSFVRAALALVVGCFFFVGASNAVSAQEKVSFENQIKPFIAKYCIECHEGADADSFRMDNDEMMSYVTSGDADESEFYTHMLLEEDDDMLMPPIDYTPRPNEQEIMLVKTWINQGAPTALVSQTSGGETEDALMKDATTMDAGAAADQPEKEKSVFEKHIYNAIGSLHTAGVHLPIGLLLAAGLFGLLSLRGSFVMSDCAYYCLWLGTWGAIFACVSGWWYSPMEHRGTVVVFNDLFDQDHKVFWHRTGGLIVTIGAFLVAVIAKWTRDSDPEEGTLWKLGAIVIAAGIGWVGHEGGELTYGKNHYKDLNAIVDFVAEEMTGKAPKAGGDENLDDGEPATDEPSSGDDATETNATETQEPFKAGDI